MKRVKKGEWYVNKECKHKKIEIVYASKGKEFILQQVTNGLAGEKHKKLVQFATLFHTLKHARPMLEYEVHKDLFDHLNLEKNSKMYQINKVDLVMAQHMHGVILEATKFVVGTVNYLQLTCDEVNTIGN